MYSSSLLISNYGLKVSLFANFALYQLIVMETKEEIDISGYQLIILDCDGTLVDSEKLSNTTIAEMIRELGIAITNEAAFSEFVGTSFGYITTYIEKALGRSLDFDFEKSFRKRVLVEFEKHLKPIAGVPQFLEKITAPICVASNGPREKMLETLRITDLLKHFQKDNMFSAWDIQKWKPEPDLFLMAATKMDTPPDGCLVIEDTIHGVEAAIKANMDVLYYLPEENDYSVDASSNKEYIPFHSFEQLVM